MPTRDPAAPRAAALTLRDVQRLGWSEHDWRDSALHRVTRGVRSLQPPPDLATRARAFALALPDDCVFSHVTAARLWGLPLPGHLEADPLLDVTRRTDRARIRRSGCRGHRGLEGRTTAVVDGIHVTSLADTWVDLGDVVGRPLRLDELVAAGDAALSRHHLPGRERSPDEVRARLVFVLAGLPEPQPCAPVRARGGGWIGEGDLVWRAARVVGEYQGAVHGGLRVRSADRHRIGLMEDEGWTVIEIFAEDLREAHRRELLLRRTARALGEDPSRLRLT